MLVVGNWDRRDVTGYLGGKRGLPRRDEGIVGRLEVLGVVQINVTAAQGRREKHRSDGEDDGAALEDIFTGLLAGCRRLPFLSLSWQFWLPGGRAFMSQRRPRLDLRSRGLGVRLAV